MSSTCWTRFSWRFGCSRPRAVLIDCAGPLASDWFLSPPQVQTVMDAFGSVVGGRSDISPAAPSPAPMSPPRPVVQPFQQGVHLFLATVAQGMPALEALRLFAQSGNGQFSHDNRCFVPTNEGLGPVADSIGLLHRAERKVIRCFEGEAETTHFLVEGTVAAVVCGKRCACNGWRRRAGTQAGWNPFWTSFLCRETRRAALCSALFPASRGEQLR